MLEDLNNKLKQLSQELVGMHVKDMFNKKGVKKKKISSDDKKRIKKLYQDLEAQVNEFVQQAKERAQAAANPEKEEEKNNATRTTLRDIVRKKDEK